MTTCALCHRPIEDPRSVWKQMAGWVSPHSAKGMTQSQPTGAVAHAECIALLKSGIALEQETLDGA